MARKMRLKESNSEATTLWLQFWIVLSEILSNFGPQANYISKEVSLGGAEFPNPGGYY